MPGETTIENEQAWRDWQPEREPFDRAAYDDLKKILWRLGPWEGPEEGQSEEEWISERDEYLDRLALPASRALLKKVFSFGADCTTILSALNEISDMYVDNHVSKFGDPETELRVRAIKFATSLVAELITSGEAEKAHEKLYLTDNNLLVTYTNLAEKSYYVLERNTGVSGLYKFLPEIKKRLEKPGAAYYHIDLNYLMLMVDKGDENIHRDAVNALVAIAETHEETKEYPYFLARFFSLPNDEELVEIGFAQVAQFLEKYHLPAEIREKWRQADSGHFKNLDAMAFDNVIISNINNIRELEAAEPGICNYLYKESGIANFGRYPVEMLLAQYQNQNDAAKPYGVIIFPIDDWNGAFYGQREAFEKLFISVGKEFNFRIAECSSRTAVVQALYKFDCKYNTGEGQSQKISLAIIVGHGTEDGVTFGAENDDNRITIKDLDGEEMGLAAGFFTASPTIILASCSTGARAMFGQKLSQKLNAKLVAPEVPAAFESIIGKKRLDGRFVFNAKAKRQARHADFFTDSQGRKIPRNITAEYHSGTLRRRSRRDQDMAAAA